MLTKKKLMELLKDAPDDALIGRIQGKEGTSVTCIWQEEDNSLCMINDIIKDANYIPLKNTFSLDDFK